MSPTPQIAERRQRVYVALAGLFLGCMTMLNILGITRFVHIGPLSLAVGVLPYPLTFLCTDFISEFYGRKRANFVVWLGLGLNVVVITFLWLGQQLPAMAMKTPLQRLQVVRHQTVMDPATGKAVIDPRGPRGADLPLQRPVVPDPGAPDGLSPVTMPSVRPVQDAAGREVLDPTSGRPVLELVDRATDQPIVQEEELYTRLYLTTRQAVFASMLAYLAAQFCDVFLFHFWKRLTRGRHLWLRNNGSTIISQLVDSVAVIGVTFGGLLIAGEMTLDSFLGLIRDSYLFKLVIALLDTIPFYLGAFWLSRYLQLNPSREHAGPLDEDL